MKNLTILVLAHNSSAGNIMQHASSIDLVIWGLEVVKKILTNVKDHVTLFNSSR